MEAPQYSPIGVHAAIIGMFLLLLYVSFNVLKKLMEWLDLKRENAYLKRLARRKHVGKVAVQNRTVGSHHRVVPVVRYHRKG